MSTPSLVGCAAVITSLLVAGGTAHAQSFAWVRSGGGVDLDSASAVAVDAAGNSYVTGTFGKSLACFFCGQPAIFGAGQPNATTLLPSDGTQDIFLAKYDPAGVLQWARRAGGGGPDEAWGIAVDGAGNSYITGLTGNADFGDGVTLPDPGAFVAKYDSAGHALWARTLDPAGTGFAIAVDPAGAAYVTGYAPDPTLGGSIVTLWKVGADGTQQWSRQATGNYTGGGRSIAVDADGNSHVTGSLAGGTALFGAGGAIQVPLIDTTGGGQMFAAKYDSSGNLIWAKQSADLVGLAYGTGIAIDAAGNSYVGGFAMTTILGLGESNETPIAGDNFVAKYNAAGQVIWAQSIAGRPVEVTGVATAPDGGVFITGGGGVVTFAPGEENETTLPAGVGGDLFVARYIATGAFEWARRAGAGAAGTAIAADGSSNAIVAGVYTGDSTFGAGEATETTLTNANPGYFDVFVAKYLNDTVGANRPPVADPQEVIVPEDTPRGIVLTGSDPDGDPLTFSVVTGPAHGTLSGTAPNLVYTPHPNYHGADEFSFRVFDGALFSTEATVTITVSSINDVPVAHDQTLTTAMNTPVAVVLSGHDDDGDSLAFSIVTPPSHGVLSGTVPNLTYAPHLNYTGIDNFTFRAFDGLAFSAPATITIEVGLTGLACGTLTSGTIAAVGEVDEHSFAGQAGQIISLAVASTGGFSSSPGSSASLEMTLVSPAGTTLGLLRSNSQGNFLLPQSGTYVVRLRARNRTTTGSYNVNLECLIPAPAPPAIPLACGGLRSGTIATAAQVDLYTFTGQAGRLVSLAVASTGGFSASPGSSASLELTLFSPAGTALALLRTNSQSNVLLPDTGTYVLRVSARNLATTGSYNVNVECLIPAPSPPAMPLTCGALQSGTIEAAGQVDLYTFAGQAGRLVSLAVASTGGFSPSPGSSASLELTLFSPAGTALALLRTNSQSNVLLPDTGTYVLRVSARNLGTTGSYNLNVECLIPAASPPAVALTCGVLQPSVIEAAGQVDIYTFEGQAGRIISLALASTGGFSPNPSSSASLELTLFSPAGTALGLLRSNSQVNFLLPDTGTYVLRVSARNLATTGSYNLNVECLIPAASPPAVPLACAAPHAGTIAAPGQVDLYTFDGAAGGGISLALSSTGGFSQNPGSSASAELTLFAPSGAAVRTIRSNSTVSFTLPETGTYVVRVSARNLATTGSYTVTRGCP